MSRNTVYDRTKTATSDDPFQVDTEDRNVLSSVNIHAYDNDVDYGNMAGQHGTIPANQVAWFDGYICPADFWFKNHVPGANGTVSIVGIFRR